MAVEGAGGIIFPILGYVPSIKNVPNFTENDIVTYYRSKNDTDDHFKKSYKLFVEEYVERKNILSLTDRKNLVIYLKGKCYRSQKTREHQYTVLVAMHLIEGIIIDSYCECAYGTQGTCNHLMAMLRLLLHLKNIEQRENAFENGKSPVSCTEMPQKWNRRRGEKITPLKAIDINYQSPKENGSSKEMNCKMYESRKHIRSKEELEDIVTKLKPEFQFIESIPQKLTTWVPTKLGNASRGSPSTYQLANVSSGMAVIHNLSVFPPQFMSLRNQNLLQPKIPAFNGSYEAAQASAVFFPLSFKEYSIFKDIDLSIDNCAKAERRTIMQSDDEIWKKMRKERICSSAFGLVCCNKRGPWTKKGINSVVFPSDIGHLRAVQYGKKMESTACKAYISQMHELGHKIEVCQTGLIINPQTPWLGTSPDGVVFDPREIPAVGLLEIKCAYEMKDELPSFAITQAKFHVKLIDGNPVLKDSHRYSKQIMGQLGLSGYEWCDFVVFFEKGLIIQRIRFDAEKWKTMVVKLDEFYFTHMLPLLANQK